MSWIEFNCMDKSFWHITYSKNVDSILDKGLLQSNEGQQGKGLYCIEAKDYDVLDSLLELMEEREIDSDKLYVIEFMYSGKYNMYPKDMLIYSSEGWCVINQDINKSNIVSIKSVLEI